MNFAHLHLVLNHIPIIAIPLAVVFLIHARRHQIAATERFALGILVVVAALVIPVFLTGEEAEEAVENVAGVSEALVETHEDTAKFALGLSILTGVAAAGALVLRGKAQVWSKKAVVPLAVVATLVLAYTANQGGQVRHTEIRSGGGVSAEGSAVGEDKSHGESESHE